MRHGENSKFFKKITGVVTEGEWVEDEEVQTLLQETPW